MSYAFYGGPGTLRPSQVITSFGPGSIAQMAHDSVLVMGFSRWSRHIEDYKTLNHPYLEELLGKDHFRMPRATDGPGAITCRSFPTWGVCSNINCRRLQRHDNEPPHQRRAFSCVECRSDLHPTAFVLVCERGHMDEFPWEEWAHSSPKYEMCDNPRLRFRARGKSLGNSDHYVRCDTCGAYRSCGKATSAAEMKSVVGGCSGRRPWLGDAEECGGDQVEVRGVSIRATSLYYPSVVTALSIPEWSDPIQKFIGGHMSEIRALRSMNTDLDIARRWEKFEEHRKLHSADEIAEQIRRRFAPGKLGENPSEMSEMQIRQKEYKSLMADEFAESDLEISDSPLDGDIRKYVDRLRQVSRITEIRVIRGFTRGMPPDPYSTGAAAVHYCPISSERLDWYPGIENKGEGLLFSINERRLAGWEARPDATARCSAIIGAYHTWSKERGWDPRQISPRYLLLHTLSHALIREVAHLSGYGEASIRERIYGEGAGGIMLYTANPSADGSLGGLVRQGQAKNFERILRSAIRRSRHCFRDPLCADDDPVEKSRSGVPAHARLNGAACYGCALLPETSCENSNQLLDRRLLFDEDYGFFRDM